MLLFDTATGSLPMLAFLGCTAIISVRTQPELGGTILRCRVDKWDVDYESKWVVGVGKVSI